MSGRRTYAPRRRAPPRRRYVRQSRTRQLINGRGTTSAERLATYGGAIGQLARTVYGITQLVNSEPKYVDVDIGLSFSTAGQVVLLSGLAQGNSDITRNGNSVLGKDIQCKFVLTKNASASQTICRLIWICDKECDGANPTLANILVGTVPAVGMLNKDFTKRFVVLKDTMHCLDANNQIVEDKLYIKYPIHMYYDGSTAAVSDCKENQVFLLMVSNEATNTPTLTAHSRINFYDN